MQRRPHRLVMAVPPWRLPPSSSRERSIPRACAETPEASMPTVAGMGKDKPTVAYWHVWTDEKGVSHQNRCEMSAFKLAEHFGGGRAVVDRQTEHPGATVLVVVQPVGWVGEWHENPKPQWIIPLSCLLVRGNNGRQACGDGARRGVVRRRSEHQAGRPGVKGTALSNT